MSAAPVIPIRSLYNVESDLLALLECLETVTPEQEQEYILDLAKALGQAKEKRDAVAQYMSHCENQIEFAKAEIKRLQERKAEFEANLEKLKRYVVQIMDAIGTRKLEGNSVTFSLRKCPPSVEITDEAAIPANYKTATLQMPGYLADQVLDALDIDAPVTLNWSVDKRGIRAALDGGLDVAGASFAPERSTVVRK
jgi:hypothetical protein